MLCSACASDMKSEQWQTISVCPHLLPRFRLPSDNYDQVFICWYDSVYKNFVALPQLYCILGSGAAEFMRIQCNTDEQWQFA
jgi:hypothetical protein